MEDTAIIFVLTLVTINVCGGVWLTKTFTEFICKVIHYMKLVEKEDIQQNSRNTGYQKVIASIFYFDRVYPSEIIRKGVKSVSLGYKKAF